MLKQAHNAVKPIFTPLPVGTLQHKWACGNHTPAGGECESCRKKREGTLQRAAVNAAPVSEAPPIVHEVLRSPSQPLDPATRAFMEPRFGHDFSRVRVHAAAIPPKMIQTKLTISRPVDRYEREADKIADTVMEIGAPATLVDAGWRALPQSNRIERVRSPLDDSDIRIIRPQEITSLSPAITPDLEGHINALHGSGERLSESVRSFFEPRFGHDFSSVRVHTGATAAETARELNARAYTVGNDVVFGPGEYTPGTWTGKRLLAHELVHVAQQGHSTSSMTGNDRHTTSLRTQGPLIQRDFEVDELREYLHTIRTTNEIEDESDSDDKARAIVEIWKWGGGEFRLTVRDKILMIQEMQSGFTGDEDERAILELLERSSSRELAAIFGPDGIAVDDLNSDFHGDEWQFLQDFYSRRFRDGMNALLEGRIEPRGAPLPFGTSLGFTWERRRLQEEQDVPSTRALAAVDHAESMKRQNIWFDSWGNDLRDNNLDGRVDDVAERGPDGSHYRGGNFAYRARICRSPSQLVSQCPASELEEVWVYYKVCIDVPLESYRAAGITVPSSRWIPNLSRWFEAHPRQWQVWRAPNFPSSLLPGDFVSVEGREHQHSGIVGTGYLGGLLGSVINLPGPTAMRRAGFYKPNDLHDVIEIPTFVWQMLLGFNFVARPRL